MAEESLSKEEALFLAHDTEDLRHRLKNYFGHICRVAIHGPKSPLDAELMKSVCACFAGEMAQDVAGDKEPPLGLE